MRYLFLLLLSGSLFAQTNPFSAMSKESFEPIATDTLQIKTLSMLSKVHPHNLTINKNPLDIDYNWRRDINLANAYDRIEYGFRQSDICGRELPPDAFQMATFNAFTKTSPPR